MGLAIGDSFRPTTWKDFVGQAGLKEELGTAIAAARLEKRHLRHVFLYGPAGFGKTTMATIIAKEMGQHFESLTMGPLKPGTLINFLRPWAGGVLLLDEIHRASKSQQEDLLDLLESGYISTPRGQKVEIEPTTIIGATTERERVIAPLRDRFRIKPTFVDYTDEEMGEMVLRMAGIAGLELDADTAVILGRAAGGVPRNAGSLVLSAKDIFVTTGEITADQVLALCRVDEDGITEDHLVYMRAVRSLGGTAGVAKIRMMIRQHESVIMELERLLVSKGFVTYGDRGRELTGAGHRKLTAHADSSSAA